VCCMGLLFEMNWVHSADMTKKVARKKSNSETMAKVKNEMAEPRMARSARHETVSQELNRIARIAAKD